MKNRKIDTFDVINIILMLMLVFVTLYPFIYITSISLSSDLNVLKNAVSFWPKDFTLKNYEKVLTDDRIWTGYKNTITFTVVGTLISLFLTSTGAYALARKQMVFKKFFMLAIVFTILFSGGMIPSYLVARELNILNTMWAVVLPGAVSAFYLIIFRTFFQNIPEELFEAGKLDGLSDLGLFRHIVLPLSKAVFAAIGLFVAVGLWNEYYKIAIYIRDPALFPLSAILRDLIIEGALDAESTLANAAGGAPETIQSLKYATLMVTTVPILVLYPFLQKYFAHGVMLGSVKQ